jgi:hypothetical protein
MVAVHISALLSLADRDRFASGQEDKAKSVAAGMSMTHLCFSSTSFSQFRRPLFRALASHSMSQESCAFFLVPGWGRAIWADKEVSPVRIRGTRATAKDQPVADRYEKAKCDAR